jgi:acyl-CoA reductase-like NAD-dependent aldehyde dehydrogenase
MGHTAIVHTNFARRFSLEMPASRIIVNCVGSEGCVGLSSGLTPSMTLGCGSYGGNSTTDNVTYTHVLNVKRLSFCKEQG